MGRVKSKKYTGIYLNHLSGGDISYSIVYKDNGGRFVRVTIGKKSNGITEKYAFAKRAEHVNKIKTGEDPQAHKKKRNITTLDQLADVYFGDKAGENKANDQQKGKYVLHIKPVLGRHNIHSITKDNIVKLQKSFLSAEKSHKTVNGTIALLRAIINHSIKEHNLQLVNPCTGIKALPTDDKRDRYLTLDEVNQLINKVQDDKTIYHFTKLALMTGARLEGVLHIQKKDIDLTVNGLMIHDIKSGGTYMGFYDDDYKSELSNHIKNLRANDYIIGSKGSTIPGRTMRRWMKPLLDRLFNEGLDARDAKNRVVIHTLRHTFASQLAIAGVPILTIKNLMNHADIEQTMRYAKLAPDQGKEAVKKLYG